MAKDYDSQLLESVSVRRRRMRDALLYGAQRARRTADEKLGKIFAGIAVAAVLCAGCVGWSFIQHTLAKQKEQQKQQQQRYAPQVTPSPSLSPSPSASHAKSSHTKSSVSHTKPSALRTKSSASQAKPSSSHTKTAKNPKGTHKVTEPAQ
ncbi:cytoskeletal protein RodZ [Streptomyces netropsis]|uniref:Cytoskeletal protein RodZ n=2 Tax=Streptomyces netropsis TaxID=55404 RepID=A0A7W7PBR2_STRNE|nr:cytoskeletal protein RodZ [Streptomyces netropsis]